MKLIDSATYNNYYEREIFKVPKKLVVSSILIFIVIFILFMFKLTYSVYFSYYISNDYDNFYQVLVPYGDIKLWLDKNNLKYDGKSYSYKITEISDKNIIKNNKVYLQLKLEVSDIKVPIKLLRVNLEKNNMTIIKYFKQKLRG